MLKIYSLKSTPRAGYAVRELGRLLGCAAMLTTDAGQMCHLTIGPEGPTGALTSGPSTILFTTEVQPIIIEWSRWDDLPVIFPTSAKTDLPFDLLGALFFFLSRHEEYTSYERDNHGRFPAHLCTMVQEGLEEMPLLDLWTNKLRTLLKHRFPDLTIEKPRFELVPTFDIDSAFAYTNKGPVRTIGGFARDFFKLDFKNACNRWAVLRGKKPDPYNIYEWLEGKLETAGVARLYFFLLADFGSFDKNVPHRSPELRSLIRHLAKKNRVGIHPGYLSSENDDIMHSEVKRLTDIIGHPACISRQHYLRMDLPETYESLIKCGITEDYTMGFADRPGFRAGTSRPFGFFNLKTNEARSLIVVPFVCMDATLRFYMCLSPEEASEKLRKMRHTLEKAGGRMVLLWHNESLSEHGPWAGWRKVFESAVD